MFTEFFGDKQCKYILDPQESIKYCSAEKYINYVDSHLKIKNIYLILSKRYLQLMIIFKALKLRILMMIKVMINIMEQVWLEAVSITHKLNHQ